MYLKRRYLWGLAITCLFLVVLHGFNKFTVDATTLGLLILAALPILREIVGSIKAGGVELSFRELAVHQQIFKFLDGIARQETWTFYPPRAGESELGQGFGILIGNLKKKHYTELVKQLNDWLEADSINLRWFAAEIIGYFKITEVKNQLPFFFESLDRNAPWEPWQLNCLWAYSRFQNYEDLNLLLNETKSEANRLWILAAYNQMVRAKKDPEGMIRTYTEKFLQRKDISDHESEIAKRILEQDSLEQVSTS